jgi:hypothetical protein
MLTSYNILSLNTPHSHNTTTNAKQSNSPPTARNSSSTYTMDSRPYDPHPNDDERGQAGGSRTDELQRVSLPIIKML